MRTIGGASAVWTMRRQARAWRSGLEYFPVSVIQPHASPAGLTRGSICRAISLLRRGWIAGSSPAMTVCGQRQNRNATAERRARYRPSGCRESPPSRQNEESPSSTTTSVMVAAGRKQHGLAGMHDARDHKVRPRADRATRRRLDQRQRRSRGGSAALRRHWPRAASARGRAASRARWRRSGRAAAPARHSPP